MITDLLFELKRDGVKLRLEGESLKVSAPDGALTEERVAVLKDSKEEIISFLRAADQSSYAGIPKVATADTYPLSNAQRRLWIIDQMDEKSGSSYNMFGAHLIKGSMDLPALNQAFDTLLDRHEILRTVFTVIDDEPRQKILELSELGFKVEYEDLSKNSAPEKAALQMADEEASTSFQLDVGPLIKAKVLKVGEEQHVFLLTIHHIVSDGWSMGILLNDVITCYDSYCKGLEHSLEPLNIQYRDYATWQIDQLSGDRLEGHQAYWFKKLEKPLPYLEVPHDYAFPKSRNYLGNSIVWKFSKEQTETLRAICQEEHASLFMGVLSLVHIFLYKYTSETDQIIGAPIAGREHVDLEGQIGFYVNTLALRTSIDPSDHFRDLLKKVKQTVLEAYDHQVYPFDVLVEELGLPRRYDKNPLFSTMVRLENTTTQAGKQNFREKQTADSINVEGFHDAPQVSKFDLTFVFEETADDICLKIEYSKELYESLRMLKMVSHFSQLVHSISANSDQPLSQIDCVTQLEKEQLLEPFNQPGINYPDDKTLLDLFSEQVSQTPENIALTYRDKVLTYQELDVISNQLAHYLIETFQPDSGDLIGILLARSEWQVIAMLAILKSGAAYVPIDKKYPEERRSFMMEDSAAKGCISDRELSDFRKKKESYPTSAPKVKVSPQHGAYVIYTSGTTGAPKGTLVEHQQVVRLFKNDAQLFDFNEKDVWMMYHSYCFDFSVWEMYGALLFGGKLVVVPSITTKDFEDFLQLIVMEKVTVLNQTPSAFYNLMNQAVKDGVLLESLRYVIFGGEALSPTKLETWMESYPHVKMINMYGITETTVHVTYKEITLEDVKNGASNIGKAIPTTNYVLLDSNGDLVPIGCVGEIYVGGEGLSRGYLNKPELNAEKFIKNPFEAGGRLYKTGDLARMQLDGSLIYFGRIDHQVKIRGFRIELDEIKAALLKHEQIEQAAVVVRETNEDSYIVAYYVDKAEIEEGSLRSFLSEIVPEPMIPSFFMKVESMPLTSNGKLDVAALPSIDEIIFNRTKTCIPPENETQQGLLQIWQEILRAKEISIVDNFFELGGHSLNATQIISHVHRVFDVKLHLKDIFQNPTIQGLAALIETNSQSRFMKIDKVEDAEDFLVSHAQRRIWVISQLEEKSSVTYNISDAYQINGAIDTHALRKAFDTMLDRHESLRTVFVTNEKDEPRQKIYAKNDVSLAINFHNIQSEENQDEAFSLLSQKEIRKPFILSEGPLFRLSVYQFSENESVLLFVIHHIIADGWSMEVLIKEITHLYNAYKKKESHNLPDLKLQYRDFTMWQQNQLAGTETQSSQTYWHQKLAGKISPIDLPTDRQRPEKKSYRGGEVGGRLPLEAASKLKEICASKDASVFMGLVAAVHALIYRYTGQKDQVLGTPVTGREHPDLEGQIGLYINTLPLRTQIDGANSFDELLADVKTTLLEAYQNQLYPFDYLVDELELSRNLARHPLFDIQVQYQNSAYESETTVQQDKELSGVASREFRVGDQSSKFDVTFAFREIGEDLAFSLIYSKDLFDEDTMVRMRSHFIHLLASMVSDPAKPVDQSKYIPVDEVKQLLVAFNQESLAYKPLHSVIELFEKIARYHGDHDAIINSDGSSLTYQELNEKANQFARYLKGQHGVSEGDFIAVNTGDTEKMIVSFLAILKVGAAYLPVVTETFRQSIEDWKVHVKLTLMITDSTAVASGDHGVETERYAQGKWADYDSKNLNLYFNKERAICATIGSGFLDQYYPLFFGDTMVTREVELFAKKYQINSTDRTILLSSDSFDLNYMSVWVALCNGATLTTLSSEHTGSTEKIAEYILQNQITYLRLQASHFQQLLSTPQFLDHKAGKSLKLVITEGNLQTQSIQTYFEKTGFYATRFLNLEMLKEPSLALGGQEIEYQEPGNVQFHTLSWPIEEFEILILDPNDQLVPIGVPGEVFLTDFGAINQCIKTLNDNNRFIDHPFEKDRMAFKTGMLGAFDVNGQVTLLGSVDRLSRIEGHRVDLAEIEKAIEAYETVDECLVRVQFEGVNTDRLLAYITLSEKAGNSSELKEQLVSILPSYMIPDQLVVVEKFEYREDGEIDVSAIPELSETENEEMSDVFTSELEEQVCEIWKKILVREDVNRNSNFFHVGGDSIKAIQITSEMKRSGLKIRVEDIFKHQTVAKLSQFVQKNPYAGIDQAPVIGPVPMSPIQMEVMKRNTIDPHHYNMASMLFSEDGFDEKAVRACFAKIQEHHDAFRTRFHYEEGQGWNQFIDGLDYPVSLASYDLTQAEDLYGEFNDTCNLVHQSMNLEEGNLMRLALIKVPQGMCLLMAIHHMISDGISIRIILEDFNSLYRQYLDQEPLSLPKKTTSFKVWSEKVREYAHSKELLSEIPYWKKVLSAPINHIPRDHKEDRNYLGDRIEKQFLLTAEETEALLTSVNREYGTEINDILLSAWVMANYWLFGHKTTFLTLEAHGREEIFDDVDITRTTGWFTSNYPVLLEVNDPTELRQVIEDTRKNLRSVPKKGVGFNIMRQLSDTDAVREIDFAKRPKVSFNYLGQYKKNADDVLFDTALVGTGKSKGPHTESMYYLDLSGMISTDKLCMVIAYNKNQYEEETITRIWDCYCESLKEIINSVSEARLTAPLEAL